MQEVPIDALALPARGLRWTSTLGKGLGLSRRTTEDGEVDKVARRWRAMLCVVAVALGLRLGYVLETRQAPTVRHLVGDAAGYHEWAGRIAAGAWLGSEPFYQAPLYPYTLAVVFKVFGDQVWMVRIVQAFWGAAAIGLLALSAAQMFGHRAGILAGIMLALYAPALFFDGIVQKTSLGCVLTCATMAVMATALTWKRKGMPTLVLGVLVALLSLVRENALAWVPIIGLWVIVTWRGTQGWGRAMAAFGIGMDPSRCSGERCGPGGWGALP